MTDHPSIQEQLRAAMARRGVTVTQLAEMLGLSGHEQVSRWLSGEHAPKAARLQELANALDTTLVVHLVYSPAVRVGDTSCHRPADPVTRNVTGSKPAESQGNGRRRPPEGRAAGVDR